MKRIVIIRHGEFSDEGETKGHLSEFGLAQMAAAANHIKNQFLGKTLIIAAPTVLMKESAFVIKSFLEINSKIIEDERWKPGLLEDDKEKKEAVSDLLKKAENYDLIIIVTNGKNIAALPKFFAHHPNLKNYILKSESQEDGAFGIDFVRDKFGCEIRWNPETLELVLEEIFLPN